MNGNNIFQNPTFPSTATPLGTPNQQTAPTSPSTIQGISGVQGIPGLPFEQSFIENILRLNMGKVAKFYFSYPDSVEWRDKVFEGVIEAAGRDHIVVSNPKDGEWYLLLIIYLNYVVFEESIAYDPAFGMPPTQS